MSRYSLEGDAYVIEDFDKSPAFSSFLPGLAGIRGIPVWVFYTNRGQGIDSFGIHNKDNAIMEFSPANTAYEDTALKGYRTFIKCNGEYFEPFFTREKDTKRNFYIHKNSIYLEEINQKFGLKITVKYFVLPGESIGALVRRLEIENLDGSEKSIEMLDGLPKIIPYGIKNSEYKNMSNLLRSWSEIKNLENGIPYYTMRSSSDDSAEVRGIEGGYYYLSVHDEQILPVIYDPEAIFDYETALVNPITFLEQGLDGVLKKEQCFYNKIPCGFTAAAFRLAGGADYRLDTFTGFAGSPAQINEKLPDLCKKDYLNFKERQAGEMADQLTKDVKTETAKPVFDQYIEQCYMDNFLRGGYPFIFGRDSNKSVVHLFSRKHGDPERDYNFFSIAGEYYSQGNGNFRDVSQNRRNDVFFHHEIGDFNIKTFFQLIQADGYNPLEVRPSTFTVKPEFKASAEKLLQDNLKPHGERPLTDKRKPRSEKLLTDGSKTYSEKPLTDSPEAYSEETMTDDSEACVEQLRKIISRPFTPGQAANCIARFHIKVDCGEEVFIEKLLSLCEQNIEAGYGEGYWSDHWDYNMDLVESYLSIYPDKKQELLFGDSSYRFYDSAARVLPRSEKYVINSKNEVRQFGALVHDEEKAAQEGFDKDGTNWLKTGFGEYATTTLMGKMITLAINKFSSLDSYGMGVEMEGGKPGWNDAMNGLPGLFGSGMPEAFELKRLVRFIRDNVTEAEGLSLPVEIAEFTKNIYHILQRADKEGLSDFAYWDEVTSLRERYRDKVRFHLDGREERIATGELKEIFTVFEGKINKGIDRALSYGKGIVPTYFTFYASEFTPVTDGEGKPVIGHYGMPKAVVKTFEVNPLPYFLEGPAKMLGSLKDKEAAKKLYRNVKASELYDTELGMYKTCVPIEQLSMENGRIRAFTPGWLERESIFLHMEYKYLLSVLKAGLYSEFFEDIKTGLVAFRDPAQYGRSVLENSSFLASSANPNRAIRGRGYQARLSGSTTEAVSMWIGMFMGEKIFTCEEGELKLHFDPRLPGWMFDKDGEASFNLFSACRVTYHNPDHKDTYGEDGAKTERIVIMDTKQEFEGDTLSGERAEAVRQGKIKEIAVYLE